MQQLTYKKIFGHLRTVATHRKWVRYYCILAGIPWRGIKHDLSKYSPVEFFESARYWTGKGTPISKIKEEQGVSYAWMHHKGRNSHHYEYWMDNFDDGGVPRLMPKNDFVEMVCDMLGASYAYTGNKDGKVIRRARQYWIDHVNRGCAINLQNKIMLDIAFHDLAIAEANMLKDGSKRNPQISSPEELLATGYLQQVWEANKEENND